MEVRKIFAGEKAEPHVGVTVLDSTRLSPDPQHERLIRRPPKRKGSSKKKRTR